MVRPRAKDLTERELEVMHVFWTIGEATATEVREHLARSGLDRSYPTIANLIRLLSEKGFLKAVNDQRPFQYAPVQTHEEVSGRLLTDLLQRVFQGSREQLLLRLLDQQRLNSKERALLEEILQEGPDGHN